MQALTLAIGPAGIEYFAERLVAVDLVRRLEQLKPPDNNITIPNFSTIGGASSDRFSNIKISLGNGSLSGFAPQFGKISQLADGRFLMQMSARGFTANYDWKESFIEITCRTME